jgi:succinate dehydrogenase/fumarate reductase flavoprotein subunit
MADRKSEGPAALETQADVLVLGGGPAGAWAALMAARAGSRVVLADKGYFGTSGATAPSNTGTWCVPPGPERHAAVERRAPKTAGLADPDCAQWVLAEAYDGLLDLAGCGYPFPRDGEGAPYLANLRGPDYMRFMRREAKAAGVVVLDHCPALELLADGDGIAGAAGIDRQQSRRWRVAAPAVVLATGGCAFGERMLGATGLTGDGYLMAAEAGVRLSGMEFSAQYGIAPAHTSLNKGLLYRWATFFDADGRVLDVGGGERQVAVARALLQGPVFARLDQADAQVQDWLRRGQPNCFLPFDRQSIDPFTEWFEVTLRCEGTVRGLGGVRLADGSGATGVAGLFAAGDVASREALNGAISGGGGPNASWAIASGRVAGRGAARYAAQAGKHAAARSAVPVWEKTGAREGRSAWAHGMGPPAGASSAPETAAVSAAVREEMLPLDKNFFRNESVLARSAARLDGLWSQTSAGYSQAGGDALRRREASALLATARWAIAAARLRRESRGIHRRVDAPASAAHCARRIEISGVDAPQAVFADPAPSAGASA